MTFWEQLKNFFKDHSSGVFTEENYPGLLGIFNIGHIIILGLTALGIPLLCFFLRKTEFKKMKIYLRISAVAWSALEIFKIIRYGYFYGGLEVLKQLPLQLCSIFLYALILSAWGKGKLKLVGDNFLATFGILGGFFGMTFTSIFGLYPIIQFNALHSMLYHASMMFTGFWMLSTKYVRLNYKNIFYSLSIIYATMLVAIIFNASPIGSNYAYLRTAEATPLAFASFLPWVAYILLTILVITLAQALIYLPSFIIEKRKAQKPELSQELLNNTVLEQQSGEEPLV